MFKNQTLAPLRETIYQMSQLEFEFLFILSLKYTNGVIMKNIYQALTLVMILSIRISAQIPNAGFENWSTDLPDGWVTNNIPSFVTPISQTNSSHSGNFALKGEVESFSGSPYPPIFQSGSQGEGFAVSQKHASLNGYYKLNSVEGDLFALTILMRKNGATIGGGVIELGNASSYTLFNIPIEYFDSQIPDTCYIIGTIVNDSLDTDPHIGSQFYLDDLSFQGINSVDNKNTLTESFALHQNYPNPFNPTTTISFIIRNSSFVTVKIFNVLGQEIKTLLNHEAMNAGYHKVEFDANNLASGLYYYLLNVESGSERFSETRKMIMLK